MPGQPKGRFNHGMASTQPLRGRCRLNFNRLQPLKSHVLVAYALGCSTLLFLALTSSLEWDLRNRGTVVDTMHVSRNDVAVTWGGTAESETEGGQSLQGRAKSGSALWLGLSSSPAIPTSRHPSSGPKSKFTTTKPHRTLKQFLTRQRSPKTQQPVLGSGETQRTQIDQHVFAAGESRRPSWVEALQRQDRRAINARLAVQGTGSSLRVDDREPEEGDRRAALEELQGRIRARERVGGRSIARWMALGHPFPPLPVEVTLGEAEKTSSSGRRSNSAGSSSSRGDSGSGNSRRGVGLVGDLGVIVLYVHKRAHYLRLALEALSRVKGISDMLLIVSHDGFFPEVHRAVQEVSFCRVRQMYFPYSVHLNQGHFPGASPGDCTGTVTAPAANNTAFRKGHEEEEGHEGEQRHEGNRTCFGNPDSNGRFRKPAFMSLKHHWFWLMNTVWDSMDETRGYSGHILFIEEDHYVFPNLLLQLRALIRAKQQQPRFASCVSVHAAPASVGVTRGSDAGLRVFVREKMGNMGYAFNRSVWSDIKREHKAFCYFDDYNWDVSLAAGVMRFWPFSDSLRWSRTSAIHFGNCGGLHASGLRRLAPANSTSDGGGRPHGLEHVNSDGVGRSSGLGVGSCIEESKRVLENRVLRHDVMLTVDDNAADWNLAFERTRVKFFGYGGWGDSRDHELCNFFTTLGNQ